MAKTSPDRRSVIDDIKRVAAEVGRRPSKREYVARGSIGERGYLHYFESWNQAVAAAGFEPNTAYLRVDDSELLQDWARVARKQKCIPTTAQYNREGKHHSRSLAIRFGGWARIPARFREFANGKAKRDWADVVALLPPPQEHESVNNQSPESKSVPCRQQRKFQDRPTYGNPIDFRGLRHEPTNENGVVFLFGAVARELGYIVEAVQAGFPDCEAKVEIARGRWQRVRIEFEYESKTFCEHGHAIDGCDVIVCWRHTWADCPASIRVVELKKEIEKIG